MPNVGSNASAPVGEQRVDATSHIRSLLTDWSRAIEREDMDGVLARHAAEIVMFDVPPQLQARGIDAYRQTWEVFFQHQGEGVFELGELEITAGDDVAFAHSIVTCGTKEPASQFKVRLTVGLRKVDGEWVVTHEHHSVPTA